MERIDEQRPIPGEKHDEIAWSDYGKAGSLLEDLKYKCKELRRKYEQNVRIGFKVLGIAGILLVILAMIFGNTGNIFFWIAAFLFGVLGGLALVFALVLFFRKQDLKKEKSACFLNYCMGVKEIWKQILSIREDILLRYLGYLNTNGARAGLAQKFNRTGSLPSQMPVLFGNHVLGFFDRVRGLYFNLWRSGNLFCMAINNDFFQVSKDLVKDFIESSYDLFSVLDENGQYKVMFPCMCLAMEDIVYYAKEGDVHVTEKVTGGGGGGTSYVGAFFGGLAFGATGAIIGSRKRVEPIRSQTVIHDMRKTILKYYVQQEENKRFISDEYPFELYDLLEKIIPEKELNVVQLHKGH